MATSPVISSYLTDPLDKNRRAALRDRIVADLKPRADRFDAIAFRGMSGALVAPGVADALDKKLIMVRKPSTEDGTCHTGRMVEGEPCVRYIILDDLVASGATVRNIINAIRDAGLCKESMPVAIYRYMSDEPDQPKHFQDTAVELWGRTMWPLTAEEQVEWGRSFNYGT